MARGVRNVKTGLRAMAALARVRDRLYLKRTTVQPGKQSERLDKLICLNQQLTEATRKLMSHAERDLLAEIDDTKVRQLVELRPRSPAGFRPQCSDQSSPTCNRLSADKEVNPRLSKVSSASSRTAVDVEIGRSVPFQYADDRERRDFERDAVEPLR